MSNLPVWHCDRCGFQMVERHCKVLCPNCGARWDCSDVTIWVDDASPPFTVRPYHADDWQALARRWPQAPFPADAEGAGNPNWVLLEGNTLRGYAMLFPVPGLPHLRHLQGAVERQACASGGAKQLLERMLRSLDAQDVSQVTYDVDSLQGPAARFLQDHGFYLEHEEWQMQLDLPARAQHDFPTGYALQTLPYDQAVDAFLRLYEESFAATAWYQPYSRAEVLAELRDGVDMLFVVHGSTPVGFAWLQQAGDSGQIEPIGIAPSHQGRGAGRALLSAALLRLAQRGASEVRLGVWRENEAAVNLYRSAGLRLVQRRFYLAYDVSG